MKKLAAMVMVVLFLAGCVSGPSGQWINTIFTPVSLAPGGCVKNYVIVEKITAFIGQEIVKVEICDYFQKTLTSHQDISADCKYHSKSYHILHSSINNQYPIEGMVILNNKNYYVTKGFDKYYYNCGNGQCRNWGILILDNGSILNGALYNYGYQMVYLSYSIVITPTNFNYTTMCVRGSPSAISFELIFSGKNDVSLNTTYKEYAVNDFARPAFFQNLTYQANAKQIRFKDFLIQIHDVTNEKIIYTIISDGLK